MKALATLLLPLLVASTLSATENLPLQTEGQIELLESRFLTPVSFTQEEFKFNKAKLRVPYKNPYVAVTLSMLASGFGHIYLGDMETAANLLNSTYNNKTLKSDNTEAFFQPAKFLESSHVWSYNIYAAYRDARNYNQHEDYKYRMPIEGVDEMARAPFEWKIVKKPEVWGGFIVALAGAFAIEYWRSSASFAETVQIVKPSPFRAFSVGVGEEALFRGFVQPALSEWMTPFGGIIGSSLLFGAAHIPNAMFLPKEMKRTYYKTSLPFITAFGAYFGWLAYRNNSLKEAIALHSWYDFTLFVINYFATPSMIGKEPRFNIALGF